MKPKLTKPDIYSNCCLECGFPSLTAHYDGCSKTTKPKTDKQGWEVKFNRKFDPDKGTWWRKDLYKSNPERYTLAVEYNKDLKDFIRLQREEVRREVVEEIVLAGVGNYGYDKNERVFDKIFELAHKYLGRNKLSYEDIEKSLTKK